MLTPRCRRRPWGPPRAMRRARPALTGHAGAPRPARWLRPGGSRNHVRPHPPRRSPPGFRSRLLSKTSWRTKGSWPLVPTPPPMGSPRAPARVRGPIVHSLHQQREYGSKMTRCGYLGTITWRDRTPDQRQIRSSRSRRSAGRGTPSPRSTPKSVPLPMNRTGPDFVLLRGTFPAPDPSHMARASHP